MSTAAIIAKIDENGPMSPAELVKFAELEGVIDGSKKAFVRLGDALSQIRDSRLYRASYPNFESYCKDRWGFGRGHANHLIAAAEVVANLYTPGIQNLRLPTSEKQARPLSVLPSEDQAAAWDLAIETAPNGEPTAAHVAEVVARVSGKPSPKTSHRGEKSRPEISPMGEKSEPIPAAPAPPEPPPEPPDILALRAAGIIPMGVAVTVEEPPAREPGADEDEESEAASAAAASDAEGALSDEDWLDACPCRSGLAELQRKRFDVDALLYRTLTPFRLKFSRAAQPHVNRAKRYAYGRLGGYAFRHDRLVKVKHPRHWVVCYECDGTGLIPVLGDECPKCYGGGYTL